MNRPHIAARTGQQARRWIPLEARVVWLVGLVILLATGCAPKIGDAARSRPTARSPAIAYVTRRSPRATARSSTASPTGAPTTRSVWPSKSRLVRCPAQSARFQRTFCMATCECFGDCRSGYDVHRYHLRPGATGHRHQPLDPQHLHGRLRRRPESAASQLDPAVCRPVAPASVTRCFLARCLISPVTLIGRGVASRRDVVQCYGRSHSTDAADEASEASADEARTARAPAAARIAPSFLEAGKPKSPWRPPARRSLL